MKKRKITWNRIIRFLFFAIISVFSFAYTIQMLEKVNYDAEDEVLTNLTPSSEWEKESVLNQIIHYVLDLDLLKPEKLMSFSSTFFDQKDSPEEEEDILHLEKDSTIGVVSQKKDPILYIYNTHQKEEYQKGSKENLPNVLEASLLLKEELEKKGIYSVVERTDVSQILNTQQWNYASSYKVTRMLLEQAKKDYSSLTYYIDLHRDSVSRKISTVTIDGKSYAKVLFVLGKEQENYPKNERFMKILNEKLDKDYPGLSRGIYGKEGKGVNGIYNQDFDPFCILLEVGGPENTMDEVERSIQAIAEVFSWYVEVQQ